MLELGSFQEKNVGQERRNYSLIYCVLISSSHGFGKIFLFQSVSILAAMIENTTVEKDEYRNVKSIS